MNKYIFSLEEQRPHPGSGLFFTVVDSFYDSYMCKDSLIRYVAMNRTNVYRITVTNENTGLSQEYLRYNGRHLFIPNELFSLSNIDRKETE